MQSLIHDLSKFGQREASCGMLFFQFGYVSNWRFSPFLIGFRRCNESATTEVLWHQGEKESHSLRRF